MAIEELDNGGADRTPGEDHERSTYGGPRPMFIRPRSNSNTLNLIWSERRRNSRTLGTTAIITGIMSLSWNSKM